MQFLSFAKSFLFIFSDFDKIQIWEEFMDNFKKQKIDLDTRLLRDFIYALNIVRRQVKSYPVGHPMVATATRNLVEVVPKLLEFRDRITLGIARDILLVDGVALDPVNPVYRDLSRSLFDLQIAALTISRELTEEEICRFFEMLQTKSEEYDAAGGIEKYLVKAGIRGLQVQGIDFSAFRSTELDEVYAPQTKSSKGDTASLWNSFASGMVRGVIDPDGVKYQPTAAFDPELLAELLNRELDGKVAGEFSSYENAITGFLNEADMKNLRGQAYQQTLSRLGYMATKLKPELRRKFLNSMLKNCAGRLETAEDILKKMPQSLLLDAIETIDADRIEIPQTLLDVIGKLSTHRDAGVSSAKVVGDSKRSAEDTAQQLATLFSEDCSEFFVPKDYQDSLTAMAGAKADNFLEPQQVEMLFSSLTSSKIEEHFCGVLIDLVKRNIDPSVGHAIQQNLVKTIDCFLETGDFISLGQIYSELIPEPDACLPASASTANEIMAIFANQEFVEKVLDEFVLCERVDRVEIENLIVKIGEPFIEPLLARLADDTVMTHRRQYMACLIKIGRAVINPILSRLGDERWYFVRNMILVLRELNDPSVASLLEGLASHPHPKVQYEVMSTLLFYGNVKANRFLYAGLVSQDPARLLNAVRLAANSRDTKVINMVAKVLNYKLPAEEEFEVKSSAIKTLMKVADETVLPELAAFLKEKKIFGGNKAQPLKIAAIAILEKIGTINAGILAGEIAQMATGELARNAEAVLVKIHGDLT